MANLIKNAPSPSRSSFRLLLMLLIVISGFMGMELFFPSLPGIAHTLNISSKMSQQTICIYLAGYGITQLFYGPLSDRFGRRPMLLVGFTLFVLGSLVGTFTHTLSALLLSRAIQGIGMGASATLSRIILRDLSSGTSMARLGSLLTIGITCASIIAPIIGGYIQHHFSYQGNLLFMAIFGAISGSTLLLFFDDTNKNLSNKIPNIKNNALVILKNKTFFKSAVLAGLILSSFIFLGQTNPFILQNHFHLTTHLTHAPAINAIH